MTTDNRTNEPTPEQIEAAAKAMWGLRKLSGEPEWDVLEYGVKNEYRKDARAALVAAQGAAPQAGSKCQTCSREASFCAHCVAEMELTPVLPSSGVDEDKLAEVIATVTYDWSQQRLEFWRKPKNVEPPGDLDTFIARAVAEWLEGQGGESRGEAV